MPMPETNLEDKLKRKVSDFYRTFFERGAENRFSDLVEQGTDAFPDLVEALSEDDTGERVDALVAMGRLFETHGADEEVLSTVVNHSKIIREGGMGPERQAALFAIGRSREPALIEGFIPLLAQPDSSAVNVALFVLGYARWKEAVPFIKYIVNENHRDTVHTAIWALGQIADVESVDLLLPMLRRGENIEWVAGALGDIGSPEALSDLANLLNNPRTDVRFLAVAAIYAIVEQNKDRKLRRDWVWLVPQLRTATQDGFPPVAAFGMFTLAELGHKLEEGEVRRVFNLDVAGAALGSRESFFLGQGLN